MPLILVAEDHFLIADVIRMELEQAGFRVASVQSSARAFEIIEAEMPKAAVVDLQLSNGLTGKTLAQELSKRGVAIVVCTGYNARRDPELGFCHAVFEKPVPEGAILDAVRRALTES